MQASTVVVSSARRLTKLYVLALSIVALLSAAAQALVQHALDQQSSDARVINIAGRQRMLSQRLSKAALVLEVATQLEERRARAQELRDVLALWSHAHVALQSGDPQIGLPGRNSADIVAMFAAIEPSHQTIVRDASTLLAMVGTDGTATTDRALEQGVVARILAAEPTFLTGMDKIVFQYDKEATARVERLKRIELVLLAVTLGVLLLEGLYVFRPAAREIRKTISDLVLAKGHLDKTIEALRTLAGADPPA